MRFFTRNVVSGKMADVEVDRVYSAYKQHIGAIVDTSPEDIAELAQTNLHDGLIRRVVVDHGTHKLLLALRCGDLQAGYIDVDIRYSGITLTPQQSQVLLHRTYDRRTEILADEIDIFSNGRFVHRLIFWPDEELEIVFSGLNITKQRQLDRKVACDEEPYIEIR